MKRALSVCLSLLLLLCGGLVCAADDEPHTHVYGDWYTSVEPTCTEEGEERRDCEGCDAFETRPVEPRHSFGDWYTSLEPTCTDEGEERRDCENCDAFETRPVEPRHSFGDWYTSVEPTCTDEGEERRDCENCDAFETRPVEPRHSFGDWYTSVEPTCTDEGEERRDCENCDAFETNTLPALGHAWVTEPAVPATCTTEGKTEGISCSRCGAVLFGHKQTVLKPLGHAVLDENGDCRLCGEHIKDLCPYCHKDHSVELFGGLTARIHLLFYRIRLLFQKG